MEDLNGRTLKQGLGIHKVRSNTGLTAFRIRRLFIGQAGLSSDSVGFHRIGWSFIGLTGLLKDGSGLSKEDHSQDGCGYSEVGHSEDRITGLT